MNISDRELHPQMEVGMQEIIRIFNKEYSKIIGFTINTDYSQNEIYQIYNLMYIIIKRMPVIKQNYVLNGYLNKLKDYLLYDTKPCNDIDEYKCYMSLITNDYLNDNNPNIPG